MATILTPNQQRTLCAISKSSLAKQFYFSGGTALSHFYLKHRLSEDLDFFSEEEVDVQGVTAVIKSLKDIIGYETIDYQSSLNRNLYFLHFAKNSVLKIEFTYYPFAQIEPPKNMDGILVDSSIDIATNKLFTIAQSPRGRDYYDLYYLIKKYNYSIPKLRLLAKQKFDWHIDPLHLASQLNKASSFLDDPILIGNKDQAKIFQYFEDQAKKLSVEILKK